MRPPWLLSYSASVLSVLAESLPYEKPKPNPNPDPNPNQGLSMLDESPSWLEARQGKTAARATVAAATAPPHAPASCLGAQTIATAPFEHWWSELSRHRTALAVAAGMAVAHGASGANAILYYSRDVLAAAGFGQPAIASLSVGVVKAVSAATRTQVPIPILA